jgi:hypothetical protein
MSICKGWRGTVLSRLRTTLRMRPKEPEPMTPRTSYSFEEGSGSIVRWTPREWWWWGGDGDGGDFVVNESE